MDRRRSRCHAGRGDRCRLTEPSAARPAGGALRVRGTGLREAAEAAGQLRRVAPHGVRVLPAQLSRLSSPVRVLIVDDSAPFRQAARGLLEVSGYRVVGEADCVAAGLLAASRLKPDAVLLDVRLPDGSGLDLCDLLTREDYAPAVLLVSSDGAADAAIAVAHGARGFVPKEDLGSWTSRRSGPRHPCPSS